MSPRSLDVGSFRERALPRLALLYGEAESPRILDSLLERMDAHPQKLGESESARWSQSDVVLITYADSIRREGEAHLATLSRFLEEHLSDAISVVHLLPFYPSSSDGGFSVVDYKGVAEPLGSWHDVEVLRERFDLMMDLVLNHCSSQSEWFQNFLKGEGEGADFFHTLAEGADVSQVVRPRTHDLLQPYETDRGEQHVWATFSRDQIDLDYSNPAVLLAMVDVLLTYVERGARIVRLDAVAFLWKRSGTSCIHLEETHQFVKLMRDILSTVAPEAIALTETNVPNEENLSYFGEGDEAHMVYQFSLPPLLLHGLYSGRADRLTAWAASLREPPPGCTYFNFTASHDGVGLRPAEGLLAEREIDLLVAGMQSSGGFVSYRRVDDASQRPYEINISLFDAMKKSALGRDRYQVPRFIASQTAMLGLRGVPAIYIHSLTATPNDHVGYDRSGHPRDINRHRWDETELLSLLGRPRKSNSRVFRELSRRLTIRRGQPAFHPDAPMKVLDLGPELFAFERLSLDGTQRIVALHNFTRDARPVSFDAPALGGIPLCALDLISGENMGRERGGVALYPYQCAWIAGPAD